MVQWNLLRNVPDVGRVQADLSEMTTVTTVTQSLEKQSFWRELDIKRMARLSFICKKKKKWACVLMHISSCTSTTCSTLCFLYTRWKGHFVGGKKTSSICICPSDQWRQVLASWPVSFDQQKANENGNWGENLLSDSDKNKEPKMHN